ncbi:MAG: Crp/Fnr family transcriptional regulator [Cyanobacteria bacterium]|jgi:CRP/FNR family cyclic AMP-dependent transcriptional regulator|nr:Crp/Fnr family transcriptional regulator [Cyanobacteriota bacterium]
MASPLTAADLQSLSLFAHLPLDQAETLLAGQITLAVAADQVLLIQQDEGEALLVIQDGLAKVRSFSADGEEVVIALLGPGDLMGEMAVLTQGVRNADVVALTPLVAVKLRAGLFRDLVLHDARVCLELARLLAVRLTATHARLLLRGADATTRLLAVLQDLALTASRGQDPLAPIPPLPQRELAVMAGLARPTTSSTLALLRERGIVKVDSQGMRIADPQALRKRGLLV